MPRMEKYSTIIVGGGPAGMMCALCLAQKNIRDVLLLEKNDRLGKKLSATGNGQGNVTNADVSASHYFSSSGSADAVLAAFGKEDLLRFLKDLGGLFSEDGEGRFYPASRQASSVTDLFRFALAESGISVRTGEKVTSAKKEGELFEVSTEGNSYCSRALVLACGGKASPHFGSDGSGYALAEGFGHSVTPLAPSLVRLRAEKEHIRGLKGVRCDCRVCISDKRGASSARPLLRGDVLFTDTGISGDAVFRLSAFVREGDTVGIDFLPDFDGREIAALLREKAERYPAMRAEDLLRCVVHGAVGRVILRRCGVGPDERAASLAKKISALTSAIKGYAVKIVGTEGFANAQVTKGGVPLVELDESLMSRKADGLYIVGELADIDGECGGYNLQWAFSSGAVAAAAIRGRAM